MNRPDLEGVLRPLKPFQRRTVDHAFERLFLADDSTSRFLVADEVGLGKTLVARGIIGRAIDHLWDDVARIDVVYICSNQSIARSNLPKLEITGGTHHSVALATRLTMLAHELAPQPGRRGLGTSKLNFVSFTPGNSFQMGHRGGQAKERQVLFHLLEPLIEPRTGLMNFLQGTVTRVHWWRDNLNHEPLALEPTIARKFRRRFRKARQLRREMQHLIETWFYPRRKYYPPEARQGRNRVLGELRQILAEECVQALEPDLVILDEFQRFKTLLERPEDNADRATHLAHQLFRAPTPEGHPVRTLLLSATPYKLYTTDAEVGQEDHYEDFLATARFLFDDDESRVTSLKSALGDFGRALHQAAWGDPNAVPPAKAKVEDKLRAIMARTERVDASEARDAMLGEPELVLDFNPGDVRQYMAADDLFRAVGARDPMEFWKAGSYLPHFMHGYKVSNLLDESLDTVPENLEPIVRRHKKAFLHGDMLDRWSPLEPANPKLRELHAELIDGGLWKLLWLPPTLPYWPLEGPFLGQDQRTKSLLFSAWNVVPDVVSAVLSYEAERRMVGDTDNSYKDFTTPLRLQLAQDQDGSRSRHRLLLLLMPCLPLADDAHPLAAPKGRDRRRWVRKRVESLLSDPTLPNPNEGAVDRRWEYMAPLLLDPGLGEFLREWLRDDELYQPNAEFFAAYVHDLLAIEPAELGRRPEGLAELLTEAALGSPAIIAARAIARPGLDDPIRRRCAVQLATAFWRLFNRPAITRMLARMGQDEWRLLGDKAAYWRLVMRYCRDGNLQAVVDEAWHLIWEQRAWSEREPTGEVACQCARDFSETIEPRASRVHVRLFEIGKRAGEMSRGEMRLRTGFSLRFGKLATDDEEAISQDAVRAAFNSPFRPFVLASTSIGQEGLDFHPWCHRLVHWNLPGNPVDLEQREGRVHRYKGHAVRKNLAHHYGDHALAEWQPGTDLWERIFDLADADSRERGDNDLVPFWVASGPHRVQRRVPILPYTREVEAFRRLKRQLAAYRIVFGQPRQEELATLLEKSDLDYAQLKDWTIDLSP